MLIALEIKNKQVNYLYSNCPKYKPYDTTKMANMLPCCRQKIIVWELECDNSNDGDDDDDNGDKETLKLQQFSCFVKTCLCAFKEML